MAATDYGGPGRSRGLHDGSGALLSFVTRPDARAEIATFRYRVLHVAARLVRTARQLHLRIDKTWRWATHIANGFTRLRTAFAT